MTSLFPTNYCLKNRIYYVTESLCRNRTKLSLKINMTLLRSENDNSNLRWKMLNCKVFFINGIENALIFKKAENVSWINTKKAMIQVEPRTVLILYVAGIWGRPNSSTRTPSWNRRIVIKESSGNQHKHLWNCEIPCWLTCLRARPLGWTELLRPHPDTSCRHPWGARLLKHPALDTSANETHYLHLQPYKLWSQQWYLWPQTDKLF